MPILFDVDRSNNLTVDTNLSMPVVGFYQIVIPDWYLGFPPHLQNCVLLLWCGNIPWGK